LTKPIAAEVLLRLASAGQIDLDAPMQSHWVDPDIRGDSRAERLTVRMALQHRTGLPNWRSHTGNVLSFVLDPGTGVPLLWRGLHLCCTLRRAAELAEPFEKLAQRLVLEPVAACPTPAFTIREKVQSARGLPP
jgi:CubicO group peptidase (beta-lactamase class C family)